MANYIPIQSADINKLTDGTEVLQLLCASCDMSRGWYSGNARPIKIGGINNGKDKGQVV